VINIIGLNADFCRLIKFTKLQVSETVTFSGYTHFDYLSREISCVEALFLIFEGKIYFKTDLA